MSAKIRINSDSSLLEIETPEGDVYGPLEFPEPDNGGDLGEVADPIFLVDEDNPENSFIATVSAYEGLKPNTLYRLVPVETEVELNAELEEDDEEDEEEEGDVLVETEG